jgi:quinol-cytochrome oxidoreductase complex cytochrome b subunit
MATRRAERVLIVLGVVIAVVLSGLIITGLYLRWMYRPTEALAWQDIRTLHTHVTFGLLVRNLHRWLAWFFVVAMPGYAFFFALAGAYRSAALRRRLWTWSTVGLGIGTLGLPVALASWRRRSVFNEWLVHGTEAYFLLPVVVLSLFVWQGHRRDDQQVVTSS